MALLSALGLSMPKALLKAAPERDPEDVRLDRRIRAAVAVAAKLTDPKARTAAAAALKQVDLDRRNAAAIDIDKVRAKSLAAATKRLEMLVDQWQRPAVATSGDERTKVPFRVDDVYTGRSYEIMVLWQPGDPDAFEIPDMPRGRFATRVGARKRPPLPESSDLPIEPEKPAPRPEPPQVKLPQSKPGPVPAAKKTPPSVKPTPTDEKPKPTDEKPKPIGDPPAPDPKDEEEARRKRREKALQDIEDAKKRWTEEDSPFVEYMKKDALDVTMTEGMENVSTFTGWMATGFKLIPGGQGMAEGMETVGLVADVTNVTYVVVKTLTKDTAGVAGGTITKEAIQKGGPKLAEKAKKQIADKIAKKYPKIPKPLIEKAVDEIVDGVFEQIGEASGEKVKDGIDGTGTDLPPGTKT